MAVNKALADVIKELVETLGSLKSSVDKDKKTLAVTHKQRSVEGLGVLDMDYTPTPLSKPVRSSSQCLEDIYFRQGAIDRETWEQIKGIEYDSYGDISDDDLAMQLDSEDEFEQSSFASYHDFRKAPAAVLEVPNVETKQVDIATAVPNEQSQVASSDSDNSGAEK